jgi:DNA repair exonuclease SbcCD ATPase subunit
MIALDQLAKTIDYHKKSKTKNIKELKAIRKEKYAIESEIGSILESRHVVFEIGEKLHKQIIDTYSEIGTMCLQSIFGDDYRYKMIGEIKYGLLSISHIVLDKKGNEIDPINSMGGGVVDVLSFALRLTTLLLSGTDRLLILDEPFRFLSRDKIPIIRSVLDILSVDYGVQIEMVTHTLPE